VLYVTGFETIDWFNMPVLSLFITSLATLGMSPGSVTQSRRV